VNLDLQPANRWCVAQPRPKLDLRAIQYEILAQGIGDGQFTLLGAPLPARDAAPFRVYRAGNELLVAIALYDSTSRPALPGGKNPPESVEIFFDPRHDHLGFFQFILNEDGSHLALSHLPYPEAHSTAFPHIELKSVESRRQQLSGSYSAWSCHWVFARFGWDEVFRYGNVVGFNLCRSRLRTHENSSWNFCSGAGFQDAGGFGHLHLAPPVELTEVRGALEGRTLRVEGRARALFELEIAMPRDQRHVVRPRLRNGKWQAQLDLPKLEPGRYRLYPRAKGRPVEPAQLVFDVPGRKPFCVSMTYDPPMCIVPNPYTPSRLRAEMATIAGWGVNRLHWIEYGDWPSFWDAGCWTNAGQQEYWAKNSEPTFRHCGKNLLRCAVQQARANGLEIFADLKVFDLAINNTFCRGYPKSSVVDLEGRPAIAIPELAAHPEWTMQANPEWGVRERYPITQLRIHSDEALPRLTASQIRLWVSDDNQHFRPYGKRFRLTQGTLQRPHQRWTPAGIVEEPGHRKQWYLSLSQLNLRQPYLAIEIDRDDVSFTGHAFELVEVHAGGGATVGSSAFRLSGPDTLKRGLQTPSQAPVTLACSGDRHEGFMFGEWGWNNHTEFNLRRRTVAGRNIGMAFRESDRIPALFEPTFEGARRIWLERMRQIFAAGCDGVSIRTLCHHNFHLSYLKYAFAAPVREEFQSRYGRAPRAVPEDYERVRRIRGEAFTQFLREARRLADRFGRKLAFQFEPGIEVPVELDTRMQIHLDYETWFKEGLLDEVSMKWFSSESHFVHEKVLPLARRHGVPVHIISRLTPMGLDVRGMETMPTLLLGAHRAGLDGFNIYETMNVMEMNPLGISIPKGFSEPAIRNAIQTLRGVARR
jgi:hypothetical protein